MAEMKMHLLKGGMPDRPSDPEWPTEGLRHAQLRQGDLLEVLPDPTGSPQSEATSKRPAA